MKVLLTGGAGFVGRTWIAQYAPKPEIEQIYVVDSLLPQVHPQGLLGNELHHEKVTFLKERVQDMDATKLIKMVEPCDAVIHLASDTGVGQSMYELSRYFDNNVMSTTVLLEALSRAWAGQSPSSKRIVLSSSRAVYGEGAYWCPECKRQQTNFYPGDTWTPHCSDCNSPLEPIATPTSKRVDPKSIYALTKSTQEELIKQVSLTHGFKYFNLRFFNVYGPKQALGNPYTGIMTTFLLRAKAGKPLIVYEDGQQSRDFVYIDDVASSLWAALTSDSANGTFNVATGESTTILQVAREIAKHYGLRANDVQISGRHRKGDIRHCTADITSTKVQLDWKPRFDFSGGMKKYLGWFDAQNVDDVPELSESAWGELLERGLGNVQVGVGNN